jgi:hypothetical protein
MRSSHGTDQATHIAGKVSVVHGMPPNGTADSIRVETEAQGEYDNEMKSDVALLVANHTSTIVTQHRYKDHTA